MALLLKPVSVATCGGEVGGLGDRFIAFAGFGGVFNRAAGRRWGLW